MSSVKDKIKAAKLPEKIVPLCLRGDLQARHEQLSQELAAAQIAGATSLAGADTGDLVEQLEALRTEMVDETIELRMRALSSRRWDELMREHPARVGNEADAQHGYNARGFYESAIAESVVEPPMDEGDWDALFGRDGTDGVLTDGQWDALVEAVFDLNKKAVSIPFSFAAWLKTKESAPE